MGETRVDFSIDYLEIPVSAVKQAKAFYGEAFGWQFKDYGPDYATFFDGKMYGGFTTESPAPSRGLLLVLYAKDLPAAMARIEAAGGKVVRETFDFPGGQRFHFTDPCGNELAVWSELKAA
jgi:predicted enzyme related to lactoylglutathione lyase